ncbi:MAG: DUF4426 domain-containing protein [Halieaceae bacterium]|jgi:hypothetical protein|nr:DUF4426 domain-containing protein [Halieaceae bacterium]
MLRYPPLSLRKGLQRLATATLLLLATTAQAQQSERFGPYELHYSTVNTTFIEPAVAAEYGITRGERRAIINLSLREHLDDGSTVARTMDLEGITRDLTAKRIPLDFIEVREGPAIYYIAEFKFINREYRFFDVEFGASGDEQRYEFSFKRQMYIND